MDRSKLKQFLWYGLILAQIALVAHLANSDISAIKLEDRNFSEPETAEIQADGNVSIFAVGDSYTYGYGLESRSKAWPAVLERNLIEKSEADVSVTPLASPGAGIEKYSGYLDEATRSHEPEIVILQINSRDYIDQQELSLTYREELGERNLTEEEEEKMGAELKIEYIENATSEFKRKRFRRYFRNINRTLDEDEEVYVLNDYIKTYNHPNFVKLFTERYGWNYYEWEKFYSDEAKSEEVEISQKDPHYNAYGNRLWAEELTKILLNESKYFESK